MFATLTKTHDAQNAGPYKATSVDAARVNADIRVVGFVRSKVDLLSRVDLNGAGVSLISVANGVGRYLVSERAFEAISARHSVATDF